MREARAFLAFSPPHLLTPSPVSRPVRMALSLARALADLDVPRHKAELYRMWLAGYHAGLEHPRILGSIERFARAPAVEAERRWLLEGTRARRSLAELTQARPALFGPFEAALLVLGEETGALEQCLRLLADHFAAEQRLMLKVKRALTYPTVQMLAASFIAPLPLVFTGHTGAYLLTAAGGVTLCLAAGGSVLAAVARRYARRPPFVRARLLRALTIGVEAGLPLTRTVELAVAAADDPAIAAHVRAVPARTIAGQPLARTFAGCPGIPREMTAAMEVAEASGDYGQTLGKMAEMYEGG